MNKNQAKEKIKDLLIEQFKILINNLGKDLLSKYKTKKTQFIYSEIFSDKTLLELAFTSSIESKMGNILNNLLVNILKDKDLANFFGWKSIKEINQDSEFKDKLFIREKDFILKHNQDEKILDLILIDGDKTNINLFEIKTGGNLDSKKGPAEVEKLKEAKRVAEILFPGKNIKIYFATLYNPKGEDSSWLPSSVRNALNNDDSIKVGRNFWEFLFKDKLTFEDFIEVYKEAADQVRIEENVEKLEEEILQLPEIKKEFEKTEPKKKEYFKKWIKILNPNIKNISSRNLKNMKIYITYCQNKEFLECLYENLENFKKEFRKEFENKSYSTNLKEFLEWAQKKCK